MSSASGRYQSKLFNFVHQQSRRFTQQCDRAFRQIQFATSWISPAVLYPFYALFQKSKQFSQKPASPQLQATQQDSSPPTPPSADTPIQQVLQLFELPTEKIALPNRDEQPKRNFAWFLLHLIRLAQQSKELFQPNRPTVASPVEWIPITAKLKNNRRVIRGIASGLASRNLVLVTTENEILDVFTPQHQEQLQAKIQGEVATYWRYQRLAYASQVQTQLKSDTDTSNLLLLEKSPLTFLDRVLAEIESHSFALTQHWQNQLNSTTILANTINRNNIESNSSTSHTLRIQALIWAAIDFFFGSDSSTKLGKDTPSTKSLQFSKKTQPKRIPYRPVSQLPASSPTIEDPWLTLSDLFGEVESEAEGQGTAATQIPNKVLPENKTSDSLRRKLINGWQRFKPKINVVTALVKVRMSVIASVTPEPSPQTNLAQINPTSEWIDVSAITMGYVKHPLEQVLEWLDRAMVWLEKILFKFWQWLKRFNLRKKD
ncbi:hypothetical protein [Gloeocapsopsis dulcis]|uniref:Uncharacterized protein n=1 Tax=Gloeocapsopsis dulcis AAB1 = 1H9 TaxID=1433147 RepID=A0A6N8G0R7_9CHRO|nr:hypothetical protein [Gloeocapsopsis dulcis]MUL38990.1 hypothetical protein [Gloeocapsopsis dulcis AAB1 = 1H9]WNN90261.1 hypothetical protein P0S91_03950 [Gloeocapsopsis dulcis]